MNIFQGENEMAWNHLGYGASIQKKKKKKPVISLFILFLHYGTGPLL